MTAAIGARPGPAWFHNIPCERRHELSLPTFTLDGHDFCIPAFEYTSEVPPPDVVRVCIKTFLDATDFGVPPDLNPLIHESPFLRGFYSVWKFDSGMIGRMFCNPLCIGVH